MRYKDPEMYEADLRDKKRKALGLGFAGAGAGAFMGKPLGELSYAVNTMVLKGNKHTKKGLKEEIETIIGRRPKAKPIIPTDTVPQINRVHSIVSKIPHQIIGGKKEKKDILTALNLKKRFVKNRPKAGLYGSLAAAIGLGAIGFGIGNSLTKEAMPVSGARGPRDAGGLAKVRQSIPRPMPEPSKPIIKKSKMKQFLGKKNKYSTLPGNLTNIGKL